jgi:type IV secretory pathway VirB2 component (pilin)
LHIVAIIIIDKGIKNIKGPVTDKTAIIIVIIETIKLWFNPGEALYVGSYSTLSK